MVRRRGRALQITGKISVTRRCVWRIKPRISIAIECNRYIDIIPRIALGCVEN